MEQYPSSSPISTIHNPCESQPPPRYVAGVDIGGTNLRARTR